MENEDILNRIGELLNRRLQPSSSASDSSEFSQGCISLLSLAHGPRSVQVQQFTTSIAGIAKEAPLAAHTNMLIVTACKGALQNLKGEIEAGLTGSLRHQITGEVLTDLVQLAREVLEQRGDGAKNVAAVLTAAAFEDTLRRMGETLAGVVGKDDLPDVLKALKEAEVIKAPQLGIAQGYFNFRNHALHANWDDIQRESVQSCLGFVEGLLTKHFS